MLNIYQLNTAAARQNYKDLLQSIAVVEPYYLPEYIEIFSGGLDYLHYFSFTSEDQKDKILMPGYLKPIVINGEDAGYFDFITPYGYTGPFFSPNSTESSIKDFWKSVDQWYYENKVVTEFIRFNLSGNHEHYSGQIFTTMLNVKGKIIERESQWAGFDHKVRKNVNKALRENLTSQIHYQHIVDEKIEEFYHIYIETMIRTDAKASFHYTLDQFKRFIHTNASHTALCTVYFEGRPISSELLLVSDVAIYSFLGGTNNDFFDKRPTDFLKVEALNWARDYQKSYYILGGGYGAEDGIFKYKKAFFPNDVVNYYTGRKVIDNEVYQKLLQKNNAFRQSSGLEELSVADTSFFPLYNKVN